MTDLPSPYAVTPRKPLTPKQKLKMFLDAGGICCVCGGKIDGVREAWDEHVDPLWLSGTNAMDNRKPAHERCARVKTAKEATDRSKVQRVAEQHFGAKRPRGFWKPKGVKFDWSQGRYVKREQE